MKYYGPYSERTVKGAARQNCSEFALYDPLFTTTTFGFYIYIHYIIEYDLYYFLEHCSPNITSEIIRISSKLLMIVYHGQC